ncbi:hypothetical protein [Maricaulis sp. MIT060901]|uniref:hypothetical protein n=1 Tax=Maricaulis sp. MIT060901 TaxID=3096993 RepID=UPI00399BE1E9
MSATATTIDRRLFALLLAGAPVAVAHLVDAFAMFFFVQELPGGGVVIRQITVFGGLLNGDVIDGGYSVLLLALAHVIALIGVSVLCGRFLESKAELFVFAIGYAVFVVVPSGIVPAVLEISGMMAPANVGYAFFGASVLALTAYLAARISNRAIARSS